MELIYVQVWKHLHNRLHVSCKDIQKENCIPHHWKLGMIKGTSVSVKIKHNIQVNVENKLKNDINYKNTHLF